MELILFIVFICLSLALVALGLFRAEHSELALVGFLFLFLLSMILVGGGSIEYKIGESYNYSCLCCGVYGEQPYQAYGVHNCTEAENSSLVITATNNVYSTFEAGTGLSHIVGYYLAIASVVGFLGVLLGLRKQKEVY